MITLALVQVHDHVSDDELLVVQRVDFDVRKVRLDAKNQPKFTERQKAVILNTVSHNTRSMNVKLIGFANRCSIYSGGTEDVQLR